jgi:integrase
VTCRRASDNRDGFRRRIPRALPKVLEPASIQKLIDSAGSYRNKAILTLLSRVGQRIAIGVQLLVGVGFWERNCRMSIASGALSQCG